MLLVTDGAVSVFRDILERNDLQGMAIRLAAPETGEGVTPQIKLEAVRSPRTDDLATHADGLDVFVAPELAPEVEHSVLDAASEGDPASLYLKPAPPL